MNDLLEKMKDDFETFCRIELNGKMTPVEAVRSTDL